MNFESNVARYTCYRTDNPIQVDGRLDKPCWVRAPVSNAFVDIVTGEPAWFDTRVRLQHGLSKRPSTWIGLSVR